MCLWCCWKDLDERIEWILFDKNWIQNVRDIDFLSDFATEEDSDKFQKPRFWKEKAVESVVTHL
jgi:hypothetical protein